MRTLMIILLTLAPCALHAQGSKLITIPTFVNFNNRVDTSLWFKWKQDLVKTIGLENLQQCAHAFHFRLWSDIQAMDIWTTDHKIYSGTVTNYAQRYDPKLLRKNIHHIDKTFYNHINLDTAIATRILYLIDSLSVITIPSDDKIPGWQQGFDGEEYLIEISTPSEYHFRTYWTPAIFADSLKEAKQIQTLVDRLYKNYSLSDHYKKLKLPPGYYGRNTGIQIKVAGPADINKISIMDWF